jgi:hypothetical protein
MLTFCINSFSQTEAQIILKCSSESRNLNVLVIVMQEKASLTLTNSDNKTFLCETNRLEFLDRRKDKSPSFEVIINKGRNCSPKLPMSLSNKLDDEIVFTQKLMTQKSELSWISFGAPTPCKTSINRLNEFFGKKAKGTQQ